MKCECGGCRGLLTRCSARRGKHGGKTGGNDRTDFVFESGTEVFRGLNRGKTVKWSRRRGVTFLDEVGEFLNNSKDAVRELACICGNAWEPCGDFGTNSSEGLSGHEIEQRCVFFRLLGGDCKKGRAGRGVSERSDTMRGKGRGFGAFLPEPLKVLVGGSSEEVVCRANVDGKFRGVRKDDVGVKAETFSLAVIRDLLTKEAGEDFAALGGLVGRGGL